MYNSSCLLDAIHTFVLLHMHKKKGGGGELRDAHFQHGQFCC